MCQSAQPLLNTGRHGASAPASAIPRKVATFGFVTLSFPTAVVRALFLKKLNKHLLRARFRRSLWRARRARRHADSLWQPLPRFLRRVEKTPDGVYRLAQRSLKEINVEGNERLGSLAHSRPALEVVAPAAFRHSIYFFAQGTPDDDPLLHPGNFDRDGTMSRLGDLIAPLKPEGERSEVKEEIARRFHLDQSCVLHLSDDLYGFYVRAVIDVYAEYATLTVVLDRNAGFVKDGIASKPDEIADRIRELLVTEQAGLSQAEKDRWFQPNYPRSESVFFGLWDLIDHRFKLHFADASIGKLVGDFRGFAVWPEACDVKTPQTPPDTNRADDKDYHFSPHKPAPRREQNVMKFLEQQREFFLDCLGLDHDGVIRVRKESAKKKHLEPNIILCRMMDGDVVYGSALGNPLTGRVRRPRPIDDEPPVTPITYFVIHNAVSAHQLGRMIRRQNLLGELRLAALFDAEAIIKLGAPLRRLSGLVAHLLSHGTRLLTINYAEFHDALQLYTEIGRKCHGGLAYRMARANYYYEALQVRLKDTRSHPIQGWQSYPGFITRHFDQRFRSMRSTGQRYVEVGARIERLYALYASERQRAVAFIPITIGALSFAGAAAAAARDYLKGDKDDGDVWLMLAVFCFIVLIVYRLATHPRMMSITRKLSRRPSKIRDSAVPIVIALMGLALAAILSKRFIPGSLVPALSEALKHIYQNAAEWFARWWPL